MQSLFAAAVSSGAVLVTAQATAEPHRLRIVNGCEDGPMWIAHMAAGSTGPDLQDIKIEPGAHHDFQTPDSLSATRYWPKMGCDETGGNCEVGDSGGPGESCVRRAPGMGDDYSHCAPPMDTKFEASFGVNGQPCNPSAPGGSEMSGCDYVDISLVDGFTLPVKLDIHGECNASSTQGQRVEQIDCTSLTMDVCPYAEALSEALTVNLRVANPITQRVAGCYSPCMRLLDTKWTNQTGTTAENDAVTPYCCPTPPLSPDACRAGPIVNTEFITTVHEKCPGAYGYAYDDSNGLLRCTSATTYVLTYYCMQSTTLVPQSAAAMDSTARGFLQQKP